MRINRTTGFQGSRRDFITARFRKPQQHIASLLVQARPERLPQVEAELTRLPGVESHGSNGAGKLILSLETASDGELMARMGLIETTEGVIAASLVYHHAEELDDES